MEYKILKVLDKYRVVANITSSSSVKRGDRYIVFSKGEEIKDIDTGDVLGYVDNIKARLKVIHVQDKFSILESDEVETYTEEHPLFATARLFGPRVRKVLKPLDVEEKKTEKKDDKIVRVGDSLKEDLLS